MNALAAAALATVVLWHSYQGAERQALEQTAAAINAEFRAAGHPEAQLALLAVPFDALHRKLETTIPRGHGPALFIAAHDRLGDWVQRGLVAPLPAEAAAPEERWLPGLLAALSGPDGRLYGLPLTYKGLVLYTRRELLARPPEELEELRRLAPALRAQGAVPLAYDTGSFFFHAPLFLACGGELFDAQGRFAVFEEPGRRSFALAAELVREGTLIGEASSASVAQLFQNGRAAAVISGPWFAGELALAPRSWEVAPLPRLGGRALGSFITVEGVLLSAAAPDPPAAVRAARALALHWRLRAELGQQPPALAEAYREEAAALPPLVRAQAHALRHGRITPSRPEMALVWEPAGGLLRAVLHRGEPLAQALGRARQQLAVASRPPPPAADPQPYLVAAGALLLLAVAMLVRRARDARLGTALVRHRFAYAMVLPALLAVAILVALPLVAAGALALFAHTGGGQYRFVGLGNFAAILGARDYPPGDPLSLHFTLGVTVLWTVVNVTLHLLIGGALALLLARPLLALRPLYRVVLILPWAVPSYITALVWRGLFDTQLGAINALLTRLGLEPVSWWQSFATAFAANVVTNTWLGFPFMMVVALGALQSVPQELQEVARLEGAGPLLRLRHVLWPCVRPALLPAVLLGSVWTFNMFNVIYLVSGGEPAGATEILVSEAYKWAFERQYRYGYAAAYAVIIFVLLLAYGRLVLGRAARTGTPASGGAAGASMEVGS
ncbi:MAG: hypothetical protein KatS3mg102_0307 [Planctomycetota bacterium]|nr:MAG: hypothetical protein KatS3mg102_0307 [Planctomycetota bacterium]